MTSQNRRSTPTPPTPTPGPETEGPDENLVVDLPGFTPETPPSRPGPDPLDPTATTISPPTSTTGPSLDDELAGDHGGPSPNGRSTRPTTSSPGSTDPDPVDAAGYKNLLGTICEQIVGMVSLLVRWSRTRQGRILPPGVWVADKEDRQAIGQPLAAIAARHAPMTGKGSDDVMDGAAVVFATGAYAMKNLEIEAEFADINRVDDIGAQADEDTPSPSSSSPPGPGGFAG